MTMAEQNNQAERAAPELPACPFCGGKCDPAGWYSGDGKRGPECEDCGATANSIENWCRRAALPAAVYAEGLPPLPESDLVADDGTMEAIEAWSEEAVRQAQREAIAADRRKQSTLQALYDAGQDIEASGERKLSKAQIDDIVYRCRQGGNDTTYDIVNAAIAYIDCRSVPTAGTVEKDAELADVLNTTLWLYRRLPHTYGKPPFVDRAILTMAKRLGLDDVPEAIKERVAIEAHNRAGKEQG